jgi:hypothetical protein
MSLSLAALLICVMAAAQDTNDTSKLTRYVTGCLQQDHSANEYQLNTENAKWHLKSDNVSLADHVGQEVKVSGVVSNQPYHGMKEDLKAAVHANPTETGVLTVTNLDIVSNTCAR